MDRQVGKQQGTGTKSDTANQFGSWSARAWITSALVTRLAGSKVTWRPEWVTGWKATPLARRTANAEGTNPADLMFVEAPLDGRHQDDHQAGFGAVVERLLFG